MSVPSTTLLLIALGQVLVGGALGLGWGPFPRWGMPGVAAGQVLAYGLGAVFLFGYLRSGRARITLRTRATPLHWPLACDILKLGGFACISPFQTVLTILILTRLVAQFGTTALAAAVLGSVGVVLALVPDLWTGLFTPDPAVHAAAASYFRWTGLTYGLFGLGLSLYFSSLGAGKVAGPVLAGTLRLALVALGGLVLVQMQTPTWTIFALVSLGMAAYGLATEWVVRQTSWGVAG